MRGKLPPSPPASQLDGSLCKERRACEAHIHTTSGERRAPTCYMLHAGSIAIPYARDRQYHRPALRTTALSWVSAPPTHHSPAPDRRAACRSSPRASGSDCRPSTVPDLKRSVTDALGPSKGTTASGSSEEHALQCDAMPPASHPAGHEQSPLVSASPTRLDGPSGTPGSRNNHRAAFVIARRSNSPSWAKPGSPAAPATATAAPSASTAPSARQDRCERRPAREPHWRKNQSLGPAAGEQRRHRRGCWTCRQRVYR